MRRRIFHQKTSQKRDEHLATHCTVNWINFYCKLIKNKVGIFFPEDGYEVYGNKSLILIIKMAISNKNEEITKEFWLIQQLCQYFSTSGLFFEIHFWSWFLLKKVDIFLLFSLFSNGFFNFLESWNFHLINFHKKLEIFSLKNRNS